MKKYVTELNTDELLKVLDANEKLQHEVFDDIVEHEMDMLGDYLDCIKNSLSDWSYGMSSHVYLNVGSGDEESFVDAVIQMQKDFGVLPDSENDFINAIAMKIEAYNDTEMYSDEYEKLETEIEELAQELADKIAKEFKARLDSVYDKEYMTEYFVTFYAEERLNESCYIETDDDDYILYEDISYTKKYS